MDNGHKTELVRVPDNDMMASGSQAEATIQRAQIILKLIAKHIRPTEIRLFGDNIHFERGACEKILMWAGANIKNQRLERMEIVDEKNERYYIFNAWGTVIIGDREVEVMGNCSTRSDFFGTMGGGYRPLSEVDIPSVMIAAQTNMWNHACVRSLGLKSMTMEDLKLAGMDTSKVGSVSYSKGSQGGSTLTPEEKQQQTLVGNWLLELHGGDKVAASKNLVTLTEFTGKDGAKVAGLDSCAKLTGKRLQIVYGKAKTEYEKHCLKNGLPMPESVKPAKATEELPTIQVN